MNLGSKSGEGAAVEPPAFRRSNSAITASAESRVMLWIAGRLPSSTTPNHMTALGAGGGGLCFTGYVASALDWRWLFLAVLGYGVHWLGDGLDGNLARLRRIERPIFGTFLDQTVDVFAIGATIIGAGLSPYVRLDVALFMMIPYLLLVLQRHMRAQVTGVDEIAPNGVGGTEGRLVMVAITFAMAAVEPHDYPTSLGAFSVFDAVLGAIGLWGMLSFTVESVRILRVLSIADPPRAHAFDLSKARGWRSERAESVARALPEAAP